MDSKRSLDCALEAFQIGIDWVAKSYAERPQKVLENAVVNARSLECEG